MNRKRLLAASLALIALLTLTAGFSYAWFAGKDINNISNSSMGKVDVQIEDTYADMIIASNGDSRKEFKIINNSTIGTYMRIGWTPIYQKQVGGQWIDLTKDTSGISIMNTELISALDGAVLSAESITSLNNYAKNVVSLAGSNESYYVLSPGTEVKGNLSFTGIDLVQDERLLVVIVPEAIQATKKAAKAAESHGWSEAKATVQDQTIIGGGE